MDLFWRVINEKRKILLSQRETEVHLLKKKSLGARSWLTYCDMNLVSNSVAGDARLEILILYFLSLYHNDLLMLSLCKQMPATSTSGTEWSAQPADSFHLSECRTTLVPLLLFEYK